MDSTKVTNWDAAPVILNAIDVGEILGISKPNTYALFNRQGFPAIRVSDRRLIVSKEALRHWLDEQANQNGAVSNR